MKVEAASLEEVHGPLILRTLDLQPPQRGEVLVKVKAAGVCHSDWHLVTGDTKHPLPVVLGHEGSGVIEALGDGVEGLQVGDHVALNWAPYCGQCFYCLHSQPNLCAVYVEPMWAGTMLDGTPRFSDRGNPVYHYCSLACFADHVVVPAVCCVPMPDGVPYEISAVIGCAVMTGVGSVLNTAHVAPGSTVAVFGAGGVGLSTIAGARFAEASQIIAIDPHESRRQAAMDMGATHVLDADEAVIENIRDLTDGRGADYVFEAAGLPAVQEQALEAARPGGEIVFTGLSPMGSSTNLPGSVLVRQEKTVRGSYYGSANPPVDFVYYAELFQDGRLPLDRLISARYPLAQINEAFGDMLNGVTRRGVIVF